MVYTSYFSSKLIRGKETKCVGVSRKHLPNFRYCTKLEPPKSMFDKYMKAKATGNTEVIKRAMKRYEAEYKRYLLTLDVHAAYQALDGKILLCFEKDDSTCHRKWIRDWFKHFGYQAEELCYNKETAIDTNITIDMETAESSCQAVAKREVVAKSKKTRKVKATWQDLKDAMWQEFFVKPFSGEKFTVSS